MKPQIHIKQERFDNYHIRNKYFIYLGTTKIGELTYKKQNKIFILGYLFIYPEYQKQGYVKQIVEHILSYYKINCIVGETLYESKGFWNKCIKQHKGKRIKITYEHQNVNGEVCNRGTSLSCA